MAEYGLTKNGVNIKRLDTILDEMHTDLSAKWGVNTRQNPNSLLNVLLTMIADMMAELWELGQDVYYSQYPGSAEGMFLDNVGQFVGLSRAIDAPSYYHILCTGTDGTVIPIGTVISSATSPVTNLYPNAQFTISRSNFNKAAIRVVSVDGNPLTVILNGNLYSVTPTSGTEPRVALQSLATAISDVDVDFNVSVAENDDLLYIEAVQETSANNLVLSNNLTTASVGCVFMFRTEEVGDIHLPTGSITEITKAVTGLSSVKNVGSYIAGRLAETDSQFRESYMAKIFSHSERMGESIKSAILNNVQGVTAIAVYENDSNTTDESGRYPHSVEVVVDGGNETEIAQQILNTKAGGINTFGSQEISLTGENSEEITVRFNRPSYVYVWFHVEISSAPNTSLPSDYFDIISSIIQSRVNSLGCGEDIIPQKLFFPQIYASLKELGYISVSMEPVVKIDDNTPIEKPAEYTQRNIDANIRQRCVTSESMIEVVISA